jgi:uncharacterized protein
MDWKGRRSSTNVEDQRGRGVKGIVGGGIGIVTVIAAIIIALLGGDPSQVLNNVLPTGTEINSSYTASSEEEELAQFVSVVLAETEDVWKEQFRLEGKVYVNPKLVLYTGSVESACGVAGSATGPFYCPGDSKVYIDLSFFQELRDQFNAPGDFAMAYVIAHEVGHHVQNLLGITDEVMSLQPELSETDFNEYLVRLELQADYLAGVWAHYANRMKLLEAGDLEEALNAASAVGDDRIQQNTQGYIVPESFTHGTSEQRSRWFLKGFTSGSMTGGDTFNATTLQVPQLLLIFLNLERSRQLVIIR